MPMCGPCYLVLHNFKIDELINCHSVCIRKFPLLSLVDTIQWVYIAQNFNPGSYPIFGKVYKQKLKIHKYLEKITTDDLI